MDLIIIIIEGFLIGLTLGSSCLISCLPVLMSYIASEQRGAKNGLFTSLLFSIGRLIIYIIFAILLGLLGVFFQGYINNFWFKLIFSIVLNSILIIYGFSISFGWELFPRFSKKACKIFTFKYKSPILLGILVGLSPCAPLFYVFAQAISLGAVNIILSIFYFSSFWIATTIWVIASGFSIGTISGFYTRVNEKEIENQKERQQKLDEKIERIRRIVGIALVIIAVYNIYMLFIGII